MKLRVYLALMAAAALVPVVLFSAIALNMLLDAERESGISGVQVSVRTVALAVDRELGEAQAALRLLAASRSMDAGDWQGLHDQAAAGSGKGKWIMLLDEEGRQLVNTLVPFGTPLPPTPEQLRQALHAAVPGVSDLIENGIVAGIPVVATGMPLERNGTERYLLVQVFAADHFHRVLASRSLPSNWSAGIFDRQGRTIATNDGERQEVGKPVRAELLDAARASPTGELRQRSEENVEVRHVFTRSDLAGWGVTVGAPAAAVESSARRAVGVAVLGLLVALICAGVVAAVLGRRLADSIAGAVDSARALGRGEVPSRTTSWATELERLHAALTEAGGVLMREKQSRAGIEAERARLLANEQNARELAEKQIRARDEFLAMLGHELRNPLHAISGAIAVMDSSGARTHDIDRAQAIIGRQARHLRRIVDDLLDLTRMSTGKIVLDQRQVDLAQVVCDCIEGLAAAGRTARHRINFSLAPAWVQGDPARLEQIVGNLLVNALSYTPSQGDIDIAVRTEADEVVLVVRDSGIGMSPELLPDVFDAFVQGNPSSDRTQGGLGIGLALVRHLAALHGGRATAESAGPGKGSTFTIRLPKLHGAVPEPEDEFPAAANHKRRVLVIEDNDDGRDMLCTILSLHGYDVVAVRDGMEGQQAALAQKPDVAIVDIGLPGMDGYDVARRLRARPDTRHIGLIALTGYGQPEDRERAIEAGFDLHLVKPFDPDGLVEAIEAAIARANTH